MNVVKLQSVTKRYATGTQALAGIDLEVAAGQFLVLLGPSGAGKSTLLRCINGLVTPTEGVAQVLGRPVATEAKAVRALRAQVGMIFQQFNLVKRLTVLENVLCGRLSHQGLVPTWLGVYPREDVERAMECLDRVGLAEKAMVRADMLSGGQQQRVGIARALAQEPKLLLADEPVASLDPRASERIMEILQEINRQDRITVIVSLHQVDLARKYGERIVGIQAGRVVVDTPAARLTQAAVDQIYGAGATDDNDSAVLEEREVLYAHG